METWQLGYGGPFGGNLVEVSVKYGGMRGGREGQWW